MLLQLKNGGLFKTVTMGVEADIPSMELIPSSKTPWAPVGITAPHRGLYVSIQPKSTTL
jgi:hypothetical protein